MRPHSVLLAVIAVILSSSLISAAPPIVSAPQPAPAAGTRPDWNPPKTSLPPDFVSAVRALFNDGPDPMADPTGGEYREVTLQITGPYNGDAQITTTHAWVFNPNSPNPTAVCWNGISYPVLKLGEKINLDADINPIIQKERAAIAQYLGTHGSINYYGNGRPQSDQAELVAYNSFDPQHIAMLLRAGRTDLAEKFWDAYIHGFMEADRNRMAESSYECLAYPYAETRARRALGFFARGQDAEALAESRACSAAANTAKKILAQQNLDIKGFDRFDAIANLTAEIQRRAKAPHYDSVLTHPDKYPDKKARIAALIRDLELVGNIPEGSTADLQIMPEVMLKLLTAEGDDIVEPLLQCYEHDNRYTRRVSEQESSLFSGPTSLEPAKVRAVALDAAEHIAEFRLDEFQVADDDSKVTEDQQQAARLHDFRVLWEKLKTFRPEDRAYAILSEDGLAPSLWIQAAEDISGYNGEIREDPRWIKIREHLRHLPTTQPSVHDLLVKRIRHAGNARGWSGESLAETLTTSLAYWEGKSALDIVREFQPQDFVRRASLDDVTALDGYAAWLKNLSPKERDQNITGPPSIFAPLWKFPEQPATKAVAEWAFQGVDSPWNPIVPLKTAGLSTYNVKDWFHSQLLTVAPFRRQVFSLLDDKREVGTISIDAAGDPVVHMNAGWFAVYPAVFLPSDTKAVIGHPVSIRACDAVAEAVEATAGTPRFSLRGSESERDTGIAILKDFLTRYGKNLKPKSLNIAPYSPINLEFGPLTAPATRAQLADGNAIFSLAGQGEAKIVPMTFPRRGRWFTNKEFAVDDHYTDPYTGKEIPSPIGNNEGAIWQAEDLTVKGKTQRFFGFVWAGGMARVPAEQMELIANWRVGAQWTELQDGIDIMLIPPGKLEPRTFPLPYHLSATDPATITLRLRNRRAVSQPIDQTLIQTDPAAHTLRLRKGLTLHLVKLRPGASEAYVADPAKSSPVPPLHPITHFTSEKTGAAASLREPGEEFTAATFNLRTYYNLSAPATYGLWLSFDQDTKLPAAPVNTPPVCLILHP